MKEVYINSVGSISAQKTFENDTFLDEVVLQDTNVFATVNPNYKDYIPPAAARRMAKGIKMGVVASKIALQEAGLENVDAIITGTGMGCLRDSEKFLSKIIDDNESYLTPTSFIQSTHNTVGAQIALGLKCKGYNFTYVHEGVSFESALLDGMLMVGQQEAKDILVGGIDELADHTVTLHKLIDHIKADDKGGCILSERTKGTAFSEGANFFVLSNVKSESTYASLIDVKTFNTMATEKVPYELISFIESNDLGINDLDLVVFGNNGDETYDPIYDGISNGILKDKAQVYYKHLCGEFNTASSFGFWMANKILKTQHIPNEVRMNDKEPSSINTILLYNQYRGENHSFTLLKRC